MINKKKELYTKLSGLIDDLSYQASSLNNSGYEYLEIAERDEYSKVDKVFMDVSVRKSVEKLEKIKSYTEQVTNVLNAISNIEKAGL